MKRVISIALFLSVLFSMFSGLGLKTFSAEETDIAKISAFNYTNPDMYVADCLVKGNIDNEGNATGEPLIYSALHHAYTYEYMAEALSDKEMVLGVSAMWNNVNNVMSGDFLEIAEMQKVFYEIVLMDYMIYISNTDEYKNNIYDSEAKNQYKIFSTFVQGASDIYPGDNLEIIKNMTVEEAISFSKQQGLLESMSDYTTLIDDITFYAESAADYIDKLSNVLTVQNINEDRIEFLKLVRQEGENHNDTDLVAAADEIISAYESGYAQIGLATVETMVDFGLKYAWKALGDANPFIKGLELGVAGLNWISNGEEASENNLKLMVLYIVNSYVSGAVRQLKSNYESNRTEENARALNNGYLMYLNYQSYATESAKTFTNAMLYEGAWNKLKNLFSDENEKTYAQFSEYFKSDLNYNNGWSNIIGARYNMYYDIIGYSSEDYYEAVLKVDVTGVNFSKESIELGLNDVFQCLEKATVQPENASNKTIMYTSSDDSVLSVNKYNPLDITLHKAGQVTVTATTEDGNFTDTLTVNIVEGHGKDGIYLEDPAPQKLNTGKCGENAYWTLYSNGLLCITGRGGICWNAWSRMTIKEIRISDGITSIGDYVFENFYDLTSVTIPDSVTSIGRGAFYHCDSLISVTIPNSVTSIGSIAFSGCSSLVSMKIPNSVTSIGDSAFAYCENLISITVPNSVASIGGSAFEDCTSLTSITIPDSVTSIGYGAFEDCVSLASITIPDNVTSIGGRTFYNCKDLTSAIIGNGVTSIGESAFSDCISLASITIPDNVTSISDETFYNCDSLTSITIPNSVTSIGVRAFGRCDNLTSIIIPNSVIGIGDWAFYRCDNLTSITILDSVTSIGVGAFEDCVSLASITIPDSVVSIGEDAFSGTAYYDNKSNWIDGVLYVDNTLIKADGTLAGEYVIREGTTVVADCAFNDCDSLTSITISDRVTSIGRSAFYNCNGLVSVIIPNSVTSIGGSAFRRCDNLTSITIPNSVTSIGDFAFDGCVSLVSMNIPNSVTSIGGSAFCDCDNLTSVTIGNGVKSIGEGAFSGCVSLTSIAIPDSVTSIGKDAFYSCDNLTSVTIGNGVKSIGEGAFRYCNSLISVAIPDSVTSIGDETFYYCVSLTSATIGNGVVSIGESAFRCCDSLTLVTILGSVTSIGEKAFYDTAYYNNKNNWIDGVLYIDNALIKAKGALSGEYIIREGTTVIADCAFYDCVNFTSITIPDSVTSIGGSAFRGCDSLASVAIPESVASIGVSVFRDCDSLTSITIPDSVTSIGDYAFYDCVSLTSITIPDSVTSIGEDAFHNCDSLISITIPDSITSIGADVFSQCDSLVSIAIPDSVTSIGFGAFGGCDNLTSITIPNSVTSIGGFAFDGCVSLISITIPDSVTSVGVAAFQNCDNLTSVTIGNGVVSIGESAFNSCDNLTSVIIKNGVTSIGASAFTYCYSLTSVTIPYSVIGIAYNAFFNCCNNLTFYGFEASCAQKYANSNNIPFVVITEMPTQPIEPSKEVVEYVDRDTGIIVDTIPNVKLNVEKVEDEETDRVTSLLKNESVVDIFYITLYNNGVIVQPNDVVTVKIPTDNNLAKVYRVEDNGELTDMKAEYTDGYMVFNTEHISVYVLAIENTAVEDNQTEPTQPSTGGQDIPADPTNPVVLGLLGDANEDGKVNIKDATLIQKSIANLTSLTEIGEALADADLNTKINIKDATAIQKHIAGIETGYPIGKTKTK